MTYKNISYCVRNALYESGANTTTDYHKFMQFGFRAYRELNLYVGMPTIKTTALTMSDALEADLPDDYVKYRAIGICVNERIYTLSLDKDICLRHNLDECCNPIAPVPATNQELVVPFGWFFLPTWRNGNWVGEQYGLGGYNRAGYFRIDENRKKIVFASTVPRTDVIMEYVSNGIDCDGDAAVPEYAVEAIIAYILWRRIASRSDVPASEKELAKQNYFMYYEKAMMFVNHFTESEALDNYWEGTTSSIRR